MRNFWYIKESLFIIEQQMVILKDYKLFIDDKLYCNYNDYIIHYFIKR